MSESNRVRLAYCEETTIGTTPAVPVMKTIRTTGESLKGDINTGISEEIRSDGQISSIFELGRNYAGAINFEMSYPLPQTFHRDFMRSAFRNNFVERTNHYNDVAGNNITAVANASAGNTTYTLAANGLNYLAGQLVLVQGFANAVNNGLFQVVSSTATTVVLNNAAGVAEASPQIGARMRVVGIQLAAGVVSALTGPNRLTLSAGTWAGFGVAVGDVINIGGNTNAIYQFATAANNTFARVIAVSGATITLDHLPTGFAADTGTGKTLRIWLGDKLENGTSKISFSIEKAFLDLTNVYRVGTGNIVNTLSLDITAQQKITGSYGVLGMAFAQNAAQLGVPAAASTEGVMTGSANAGGVFEAGAAVADPVRNISLNINNNVDQIPTIGLSPPAGQNLGRCIVTGSISVYQTGSVRYSRYVSFADTDVAFRSVAAIPAGFQGAGVGRRGLFMIVPNMKFGDADDTASGPDQMLMETYNFSAYIDPVTGKQISMTAFEYVEA